MCEWSWQKLHANGIKIGIVTSKIRQTTLMGLKLCGLDTFVSTIVTVEDVKERNHIRKVYSQRLRS